MGYKVQMLAGLGVCALASSVSAATVNFAYTGTAQTWTVPAGVTQVTLDLRGAQGGGGYPCGGAGRDNDGGLGGQTLGTLAVTPGAVLQIYVGGQATDVGNITPAPGGFNGGGAGGQYGAGGGGASDVRVGGNAWANRVAVAGGGGGGNTGCPDYGAGGAGGGSAGAPGVGNVSSFTPGGGGTQSAGGAAGSSDGGGGTAQPGQLGQGGSSPTYHFAGGGGGYYGGGSAYGAGGGGGSGFTGTMSSASTVVGVQAGHGAISIHYADPVLAPVAVPSLGAGMLAALAASVAALGAALARRQRRRSA